ncbi:MAG: DUF3500 domain-containing protein, partial [Gemmatimonadota bacterium]|nr:DUF3500 domain-containing protein [Gemmatimonadota bacterium]
MTALERSRAKLLAFRLGVTAALTLGAGVILVRAAGAGGGAGVEAADTPSVVDRMSEAGAAYLATLDGAARERGSWSLDADARYDWHFVPREREGMPLEDMTTEQRSAAHTLLQSVLSGQGYLKATGVMTLEGALGVIEGRPERRNPQDYYFSLFGEPSPDAPWAWRFEGHHISMNFTSAPGGLPSVTPAFIGSNPHVVGEGPLAGWRLLGGEEDRMRDLLAALGPDLETARIADAAPDDIVTGNARRVEIDGYEGMRVSDMTPEQHQALMLLLEQFLENAADEIADAEMDRIHAAG